MEIISILVFLGVMVLITTGKIDSTLSALIGAAVILLTKVLSFDEASKFLNLSKSYLYKLTSGNLIPHYKPQGKMLYFEKAELEAWLRQNPIKTSAQIAQEAQKYIMGSKPLMQK